MSTKQPTGYVVYRGPSKLNGEPIVAVAVTSSSNRKTGDMVQTYILPDNGVSPAENAKSGADSAVCGQCPHRHYLNGACYVNLIHGPRAVHVGLTRGIYPADLQRAAQACAGRMVRLGSYGDPAAVPAAVWDALLINASGHTGYTHQWARDIDPAFMRLCMASADSADERAEAKRLGYRTFRVRDETEELQAGEFICPASEEAGKRKTCADCGACSGGIDSRKADPVIVVHGALARRFAQKQQSPVTA